MGEAVSPRLAIGVGFRAGSSAAAIEALVREAWDRVGSARPAQLCTLAEKAAAPSVREAAEGLGLALLAMPRAALEAAMPGVVTPSEAARAALGLLSVSEAAALAGAGPGARLLLPRIAWQGVTCAVAAPAEGAP